MANAFTTPEPVKEEECNHKICLDLDFLAESDEDSDSEIVRQMFSYVENQRKRKLEEDEEEVDLVFAVATLVVFNLIFWNRRT